MSKRKLDKIDGHEPWEVEAAALAEHLKLDPDQARAHAQQLSSISRLPHECEDACLYRR